MTTRTRRRALGLLAVVAVLVTFVAGMWAVQRRLIYFPDGDTPSISVIGPGWEGVSFETTDGLTLAAWYRPPEPGQAVAIVFSGNAGNRADRATLGTRLARAGLGVLLTDYRGYGGNPGHPTEEGLAHDAQAAAAFVQDRSPDSPLVYFGESLGAGVAVELATVEPPAVLVLRSPFTSLTAIGRHHYPWLPVSWLLKDRFPSDERIGSLQMPTMVIAGDEDSIVPVDQSREIFDAAPGPKELFVIPGADHNDASLVSGPEMIDAAAAFIAEAIEP